MTNEILPRRRTDNERLSYLEGYKAGLVYAQNKIDSLRFQFEWVDHELAQVRLEISEQATRPTT